MYRFYRRYRGQDFAMVLAGLFALFLIVAGHIVASVASKNSEEGLTQKGESLPTSLHSPSPRMRD
jgi:hypothetical protein